MDFDSAMNGGSLSTSLHCNATFKKCYDDTYTLTEALQYQRPRMTKYYAIAGIDHKMDGSKENDCIFEMPTNYTTYEQVENFINTSANLNDRKLDVQSTGDDVVGLLSQIGWKEERHKTRPSISPIHMEKICIDVDKNGGNGPDIGIVEFKDMFHGKVTHRSKVMKKIYEYLEE